MKNRPFRILSLSGGGARGIFQAVFLWKLQSELNVDLRSGFDFIAGSSTGAITGLAVALGIPLHQVIDIYMHHARRIFKARLLSKYRKGPRYSQEHLRNVLEQTFGGRLLRDASHRLLFTATATDRFEHRIFSNFGFHGEADGSISAVEIALASAAAPTYFPPVTVSPGTRTYIDGGLWANSPLVAAILAAHRELNVDFSDMRILSIDTGTYPGGRGHQQLARLRPLSINTVQTVLDSISGAQASFATHFAAQLLGSGRFVHITAPLQSDIPLDDAKQSLEILPPLAEREAANAASTIREQFFESFVSTPPEFIESRYRASHDLIYSMLPAAGLTGFYPERRYYRLFRTASSVDTYVRTARKSVVMISINLMTGIPFNDLCEALRSKIASDGDFTVTISLLDPSKSELMGALGPVLNTTAHDLAKEITKSLATLRDLRECLPEIDRSRLSIRVHRAIPFGSAILLDHDTPDGRIQIETKVYKAPFDKSFAFEVGPAGTSVFFGTLVKGYSDLMKDGAEFE
jgi:uncharacterized protein